MNATQGTILIMIGALVLYLTWGSKSPFASSGAITGPAAKVLPQPNVDNNGKECPTGFVRSAFGTCVKQGTDSAGNPVQPAPANPLIPLPFDCANRGGTWDWMHNVCVIKQ